MKFLIFPSSYSQGWKYFIFHVKRVFVLSKKQNKKKTKQNKTKQKKKKNPFHIVNVTVTVVSVLLFKNSAEEIS